MSNRVYYRWPDGRFAPKGYGAVLSGDITQRLFDMDIDARRVANAFGMVGAGFLESMAGAGDEHHRDDADEPTNQQPLAVHGPGITHAEQIYPMPVTEDRIAQMLGPGYKVKLPKNLTEDRTVAQCVGDCAVALNKLRDEEKSYQAALAAGGPTDGDKRKLKQALVSLQKARAALVRALR